MRPGIFQTLKSRQLKKAEQIVRMRKDQLFFMNQLSAKKTVGKPMDEHGGMYNIDHNYRLFILFKVTWTRQAVDRMKAVGCRDFGLSSSV